MSRSTRWLAVFAVAAAVAPAVMAEEKDKITGDLKKMQGTWSQTGGDGPEVKWAITGEKLKAEVNGQEYVCTLTLDPKAKPHPSADIAISEGPGDSGGKTSKAIYKFDGDKLVFCVTHPGAEARPAEFKGEDGESFLFEMKKEK